MSAGGGSPPIPPGGTAEWAARALRLHSRRPQAEAERYAEALALGKDVDFFILVEPGMGYLVDALRRQRPAARAVILHADPAFREFESRHPGVPAWYPDSGKTAQEFLEREIPEGASARIVEWRPSLSLYGPKCLELVRESAEFVRRAEAGRRTAAAFGRRWARNFFRNLELIRSALMYRPIEAPIVVAGAGPGLEAALPEIRAAREGAFVLACSSALAALAAGGVAPDMAVCTDGGGWAHLHLHACFRPGLAAGPAACAAKAGAHGGAPLRLAAALSAALPSRCCELPILPLSDGSLWQALALGAAGIPSAPIPQRGTVAATALELALQLSKGPVFLAGVDLSVEGGRSHARPHGFDHLFIGSASRLRPACSQAFARSRAIAEGGSLAVYAAWFKSRLGAWRGRVFALGGGHGVFESAPLAPFARKAGAGERGRFEAAALQGSPGQRRALAAGALRAALKDPRHAERLSGELEPLLFPSRRGSGGGGANPGELAEALLEISGRRRAG